GETDWLIWAAVLDTSRSRGAIAAGHHAGDYHGIRISRCSLVLGQDSLAPATLFRRASSARCRYICLLQNYAATKVRTCFLTSSGEQKIAARSSRDDVRRFLQLINTNDVFGTHTAILAPEREWAAFRTNDDDRYSTVGEHLHGFAAEHNR